MTDAARWKPLLLSAVIAGCLLAQAGAVLQPFIAWHGQGDAYLWPFLDYPMYGRAYGPQDSVNQYRVIGYVESGAPVEIRREDFGVTYWKFLRGPVRALEVGRPEQLSRYLAIYEAKTGRRLEAVELRNDPVGFGPRGIETRPSYVVNRMAAHSGAGQP